jgi:hypothetical protein
MASLADVFRELNTLKTTGVVRDYAIGGATAVLFFPQIARVDIPRNRVLLHLCV